MSEEQIAELVKTLRLPADVRMVVNCDMGPGADVFVILDGQDYVATIRRRPGVVINRRGTLKSQ